MTRAQAQARHAQLAEEIRQHDHAYYVLAQPAISDREYDALFRELQELEKQFPELCTPESPTPGRPERCEEPAVEECEPSWIDSIHDSFHRATC